jgi:hypothetical protein
MYVYQSELDVRNHFQFETDRIKNPSKDQVYKRIFDNSEGNNKVAKEVIITMMNKNSEKAV